MLAQFFQVVICDLSQPQMPRFVAFKALLNMARPLLFVFIVASTFQRTRQKNGSCTQEKQERLRTGNPPLHRVIE